MGHGSEAKCWGFRETDAIGSKSTPRHSYKDCSKTRFSEQPPPRSWWDNPEVVPLKAKVPDGVRQRMEKKYAPVHAWRPCLEARRQQPHIPNERTVNPEDLQPVLSPSRPRRPTKTEEAYADLAKAMTGRRSTTFDSFGEEQSLGQLSCRAERPSEVALPDRAGVVPAFAGIT